MAGTVFWSWQSDRNERVTRHLIREALVIALDRLAADAEIEDRLEIDHDTRGLPGSPDIVSSILKKIDAAEVFVADVTPIAVSESGKHIANPNVLIELGYAKSAVSVDRVITVWNTSFTNSRFEDLPFDLRGRRGPITFSLPENAKREDLGKVRQSLADDFVSRIGDCLAVRQVLRDVGPDWQPATPADPSLWIEPGLKFPVNEGYGSGVKSWTDGGRWYVRVLPSKFDPLVLDRSTHGPFVGRAFGYSAGRVKGGLLTYSGSVRSNVGPQLHEASMWFRATGEIWAAQTGISSEWKGRPSFHGDHIPEEWASTLRDILKWLTEHGGEAPFQVRLGVTGLEGLFWSDAQRLGGEPPAALEDRVELEFEAHDVSVDAWRNEYAETWRSLRRIFGLGGPTEDELTATIERVVT